MSIPLRSRFLLGLFTLALIPRLLLVLAFLNAPIGLDDMFQYDMLARSLASGKGYRWYQKEDVLKIQAYIEKNYPLDFPIEEVPVDGYRTVFRAPGYPFFLAILYGIVGPAHRIAVVRLIQALLGALLAPLTAILALRLGFPQKAARLTGILLALYPILWLYPIGLASENTFILMLLLAVMAILASAPERPLWYPIGAGILLGSAILTRSSLSFFLPPAIWWLWRRVGKRQALALGFTAICALMPWMIRNSLILGKPAFIEYSIGYNAYIGFHPESEGVFNTRVAAIPLQILDDGERDEWCFRQARHFIQEDPARVPSLLLRRLSHLWGPEDKEVIYFYSNNYLGSIPQPWLLLAYLGLILPLLFLILLSPLGFSLEYRHPATPLILALILSTILAYVPILAEPRFHLPLIPFLAVFAIRASTAPLFVSSLLASLQRGDKRIWLAAVVSITLGILWALDLIQHWNTLVLVMSSGGNNLRLSY